VDRIFLDFGARAPESNLVISAALLGTDPTGSAFIATDPLLAPGPSTGAATVAVGLLT